MIEEKSGEELAAFVMGQVRKTAIWQNLTGVEVDPCGHESDWEIKHRSFNGSSLSDDRRNELTTIVIELKKRYRLK
jgi:hypothetical protein